MSFYQRFLNTCCPCLRSSCNNKTDTKALLDQLKGAENSQDSNELAPKLNFLDLPNEIQDLIIAQGSTSTFLNLRLTCKHLHQFADPIHILRQRLREDAISRYELTWIRERLARSDPNKQACIGCLSFHQPSVFTEEGLQKHDSQRECRGSQRRFRLAPDFTLSHLDLLGHMNDGLLPIQVPYETVYQKYSQNLPNENPWFRGPVNLVRAGGINNITGPVLLYNWHFDIDSFPLVTTQIEALVHHLGINPIRLCLHTYSNHHNVAASIRKTHEKSLQLGARPWTKLRCPTCSTDVSIFWEPDRRGGLGVVRLLVQRQIASGTRLSALDPEWILQTEAKAECLEHS